MKTVFGMRKKYISYNEEEIHNHKTAMKRGRENRELVSALTD